jgi:hypothetical protein
MNRPPLTIEEQKDYIRRQAEGFRIAKEMQVEETRNRTEAERWIAADRLLMGAQVFDEARIRRRASSGLIEQQRLFGRLRKA